MPSCRRLSSTSVQIELHKLDSVIQGDRQLQSVLHRTAWALLINVDPSRSLWLIPSTFCLRCRPQSGLGNRHARRGTFTPRVELTGDRILLGLVATSCFRHHAWTAKNTELVATWQNVKVVRNPKQRISSAETADSCDDDAHARFDRASELRSRV
eukprot:970219-Pleurochrysis_carterae.AAC.1